VTPEPGQRLTLRCRHLLPMHGPAIEGGWIRVRGSRIVALGSGPPPGTGPIVDLGDAIVLPGLVNAHTHLEFSDFAQPLTAAGGLPAWIRRVVESRRARSAGDDRAASIAAGLAESAASGVTCVGEIATSLPTGGYGRGPRVRAFREGLGLSATAVSAAIRSVGRDLERLRGGGFATGVSPHAPYSVAAPLARRLVDLAQRRRLPLATHVAESVEEAELLASGGGPFRTLLEDLGAWPHAAPPQLLSAAEWISLLARASRGLVIHGTHLGRDADAIERLARHRDRLGVVVCPRTTLSLSGSPPPVTLFRAAGLRVALGTDSRASNPDLSVLTECRALVDAGLAAPKEALHMATAHGAWALGFERRAGILAPDRPADLVVLRPSAGHRDPFEAALDPASRVVATLRSGRIIAGSLTSL